MPRKNKSEKERRHYIRPSDKDNVNCDISIEKRKFIRIPHSDDVAMKAINHDIRLLSSKSKNISQVGIQVLTDHPLNINTLVAITIDSNKLRDVINTDKILRESNDELIGNVVRTEKINEKHLVSISFLMKGF